MRWMLSVAVALGAALGMAAPLYAHFLFVVPAENRTSARVILSETLEPDENVEADIVDPAKLFVRDAAGKDKSLSIETQGESRIVKISPHRSAEVFGSCELGVNQRGDAPPFLLTYHPKTILHDPFAKHATLGEAAPVELIPVGKPGDVRFQLVAGGKPVADSELTVIAPDGTQKKTKTDAEGMTEPFTAMGRYGVWARYFEPTPGERDGKSYQEIRRYPTLVVDITDNPGGHPVAAGEKSIHPQMAPMPEATSSFGAVACDGWLYVYGGHISRTHSYSTEAVSHRFHRLNLGDGKTWEELAGGPGLQGMNLAACDGKIYRIGGMEPRNKPGEDADNYSVPDCACFDPAVGQWAAITPLPEPRSSHDVAVIGHKLYVIGGWNMLGTKGEEWLSDTLVMDLSAEHPVWTRIEQPFKRRALIVAVDGAKIYVIGGFMDDDTPSLEVDVLDTTTGTWSSGPQLPGQPMNGFAPAACTLDSHVYVSVADGTLYRLNKAEKGWEKVTSTTPRIVHRLAPHGSTILVLGGASRGNNFDLVEVVNLEKTHDAEKPNADKSSPAGSSGQ